MTKKIKRNDPCHCGSGKKYKKCCYATDHGPRKINATVLGGAASPLSALISKSVSQQGAVSNKKISVSKIGGEMMSAPVKPSASDKEKKEEKEEG